MSEDEPSDRRLTKQDQTLVANAVANGLRQGLASELGDSGFEHRDHYETFGWPDGDDGWDEDNYYALYLRNPWAYAVVAQKAKTTWKHAPEVVDRGGRRECNSESDDNQTEFEQAVATLAREHDVWSYAARADRMAGIGQHGLLVYDFADTNGPDDFKKQVSPPDSDAPNLEFLRGFRVYPEPMIEEIEYGQPGSDRWGEPIEYQIDLGDDADVETDDDESGVLHVHHSRVVDIPSRELDDDETKSRPRMEPVLNNILDMEKAYGSTAELSYRAADYGLAINIDPEKVDPESVKELVGEDARNWYHGLQPFMRTVGADVERLGGEVKDPSGIIDPNIKALSAYTGIPKRMIEGASAGELASAQQDEKDYLGTVGERQQQYAGPHIARGTLDPLVEYGVLPSPNGVTYDINWPDLTELSDEQKASLEVDRSQVVKNLETAVPDLRGERAEQFVETGTFPDRTEGPTDNVDETDPAVWETFHQAVGNARQFAEGDPVQTPQGLGVVTDIRTEPFEGKNGEVEASTSSPTYIVGLKDARVGVGFYTASQLEATEMPKIDLDSPVADVTSNATGSGRPTANDWTMPKSWRQASTPARIILLDAWSSMGGTFRGARRHLKSARLAAAMKDEVLGGWTGWRDGG
ncbi:Protein of unknown function [Halogeometricum rufum]|uniref:Anti-CBASS protein Acb1-like N-terminal domain-containing protein n=1 Tax=Halogeometricum rufum TaxID=553469 RepID=A0A1I6GJ08_9EURY|nr:anti-CBASS Acb1 family protein [Halogeometricum rufum]SFR42182.1 Protein of unknown function [Halogeometricum rufum]